MRAEEREVGVEAPVHGVVVARGEVHVAASRAPHGEHLGVHLVALGQGQDADAGLAEEQAPVQVLQLVEARAALQQHGHVLARARGPHEALGDGVARPHAVEADAQLIHFRVGGGAVHEALHHAVVVQRVVEGGVALVQQGEGIVLEVGRAAWRQRRIAQGRRLPLGRVHVHQRVQVAVVERRREAEGGLRGQLQRLAHLVDPGEGALHLQPRGRALGTVLDGLREVVPARPFQIEVGQPRDAHLVHGQVLGQEEVAAQAHERPQPHERPRPPGHGQQARQGVGQAHEVVERFAPRRQVEGAAGQPRQRPRIEQVRARRRLLREVGPEVAALQRRQLRGVQQVHADARQLVPQLLVDLGGLQRALVGLGEGRAVLLALGLAAAPRAAEDAVDARREELVEVGGEDGEEAQLLQQGHVLARGLQQHAVVEAQPRALPRKLGRDRAVDARHAPQDTAPAPNGPAPVPVR